MVEDTYVIRYVGTYYADLFMKHGGSVSVAPGLRSEQKLGTQHQIHPAPEISLF